MAVKEFLGADNFPSHFPIILLLSPRNDAKAVLLSFNYTIFSVSLVERAACSFRTLIKPRKQAGSMFY